MGNVHILVLMKLLILRIEMLMGMLYNDFIGFDKSDFVEDKSDD